MKLAVLTSGGDSAGMNAVVRAVVKAGILKCALLSFFPIGLNRIYPHIEGVRHGSFEKDTKAWSAGTQTRRPLLHPS